MLRDRLICGVNHGAIQRKLLAEKDLTFAKAFTLAQAIETAEKDTVHLKGAHTAVNPPGNDTGNVYFTGTGGRPKKGNPTCYRCGGPHLATACKFIEAECRFCHKKGHIAKVCRSKGQHQEAKSKYPPKKTHYMQEEATTNSDDGAYSLFTVRDSASKPIVLQVSLNSVPVDMELDTGASTSVLNHPTYRSLLDQEKISSLRSPGVQLKTYTGQPIVVLGSVDVRAECMGKVADVSIQVVDGDGPNLMGRDWLNQLG